MLTVKHITQNIFNYQMLFYEKNDLFFINVHLRYDSDGTGARKY